MKKNNDNNVIKSMLIGISAFITMVIASGSMSMDVYAADGEADGANAGDNPNSQEANQSTPTIDSVQENVESAAGDVSSAVSDVQEAVNEVKTNEFFSETTGNATVDQKNDAIEDSADTLKSKLDGPQNSDNKVDAEQLVGELQSTLAELDNKDTAVTSYTNLLNGEITNANNASQDGANAAEAAKNALGLGTGSVESIPDAITGATGAVDQAEQDINNASSAKEANGYLEKATDAVNEASNKVDSARTDFDKASNDYDVAKSAYDTAEDKIKEYKDILEGTTNENGEKVKGLLEEYEDLQKEASAQAKAASDELERLGKDSENLKNKTDDAYKAYTGSGYEKIAALEYKISTSSTPSWDDYRALAIAMIETYYIPEELHGEVTESTQWFNDWKSYGNTYTFADGKKSTPGDVLNYGLVKYNDKDGNAQELYFNYKTANANNRSSKDGVVVFQKVKHNMLNGTEISDEELAELTDEQKASLKVEFRNDNWYKGDLIIAEYDGQNFRTDGKQTGSDAVNPKSNKITVDEEKNNIFREKADAAKDRITNYIDLLTKAQKAMDSAKAAKDEIDNIKNNIDALTGAKPTINELNEMSTGLQGYAEILQKAEKDRDDLKIRLNELKGYIASKFPAPTPSAGDNNETSDVINPGAGDEGGAPGTGGDGGSTTGTPAAPAGGSVIADAVTADAGNGAATENGGIQGVLNGGGAAAGNGVVLAGGEDITIGDQDTALAGSIQDATEDTTEKTAKKTENVNIQDQDTALADFDAVDEEGHGWKWWLLALIAGTVTIEEYIRRKRNNAALVSTDSDSETTD